MDDESRFAERMRRKRHGRNQTHVWPQLLGGVWPALVKGGPSIEDPVVNEDGNPQWISLLKDHPSVILQGQGDEWWITVEYLDGTESYPFLDQVTAPEAWAVLCHLVMGTGVSRSGEGE